MSSDTRGRGRGRGRGGSQGGPASGGRGGHGARGEDKPRREAILDLAKYTDKKICGYDQLLNLVMDDIEETLNGELFRDPETGLPAVPPRTRSLGLAVIRGTSLVLISPLDGSAEIANPFQTSA
ncbi:Sm-like protein lsm7 [Rhodotorula mucilaginosa]|uniref:Sm-like protein lsm7 n=1 Tax=Rhodotorula mucilaginosa TaxID=5537 RepID=A0A9P6VTE2_RHOMI|nr:Sm-like protein lsm7 [Rhodotorula mucilaginosa]